MFANCARREWIKRIWNLFVTIEKNFRRESNEVQVAGRRFVEKWRMSL